MRDLSFNFDKVYSGVKEDTPRFDNIFTDIIKVE
jgi:hypothetical protein